MTNETPTSTSIKGVSYESPSALLEYTDPILHETENYGYSSLPTNKKRIRLLRLYAGAIETPTVTCQIFEAEFVEEIEPPVLVDPDGNLTNAIIEYEALSWRWSDETHSPYAIILIGNDGEKRKKIVSKTLGLSMKYLRREEDRILWIDAICINQSDMKERSSQVSMMSHIYTRAKQVCIWLGEDDPTSRKAIELIREVDRFDIFEHLERLRDPKYTQKWRAFLEFMQGEWFTRRWIVQEIILAVRASVYCGTEELEWRALNVARSVFEAIADARPPIKEGRAKQWFESMSQLSASTLLDTYAKVKVRDSLSLEYLVTSLVDFECGQPHDHVYALIAIAKDAFPTPPTFSTDNSHAAIVHRACGSIAEQAAYPVDYNCTYPVMCKTFVEFCVQICAKRDPGQALDVLCRPWAKAWEPHDVTVEVKPVCSEEKELFLTDNSMMVDIHAAQVEPKKDKKETSKPAHLCDLFGQPSQAYLSANKRRGRTEPINFRLPSWVATVDKAPFRNVSHIGILGVDATKMERNNADLLVGSPDTGQLRYSAGQPGVLDINSLRFRNREFLDHYSLYVQGFCFDRVASVSQASRSGTIPWTWFDFGGWPEATGTKSNTKLPNPPDAFWRTLVADRDKYNRSPPPYYARACREIVIQSIGSDDAIDTTAPIYSGDFISVIEDFCRRLLSVIWNRVMIKTKKGSLGLVSEGVREGDLICILYGCTVPVILRQKNLRFKTEDERKNEIFEDGVEAMKKLVARLERCRERKSHYSEMSGQEQAEVKKYTASHNKEHAVKQTTKTFQQCKEEDEVYEREERALWGKFDTQSDIDSEDDVPVVEEDHSRKDVPETKEKLTEQQKLEKEQETAKTQRGKDEGHETQKRRKERQRTSKIRDPLRHYGFLDQAYIHGMMDGEAVRQKFHTGRSDHVFEIR
jgi:hypothetical protein